MHQLIEASKLTKNDAQQKFGNDSSIYEDFLKTGLLRDNDTESGIINFVGVGISNKHSVKFLPKIFRGQNPPSDKQFSVLVRILKKYAKTLNVLHPDAQFLRPKTTESSVSQLAQADLLISDYLSNGLYRTKPSTKIRQGAPTIDWVKTISRTNLTMSNGRPVYLNPVGRTNQEDNTHIVARLHRYAIETCFSTYAPLLGFPKQTLDHEIVISLSKLPEPTIIERVLKQELYRNFSDRDVRLLKMLIVWFQEEQFGSSKKFKPYGVRYFWAVWESVCKLIFHDEVASWRKMIPAPLWNNVDGNLQYAEGKWLPDVIMSVHDTSDLDTLFILDAKYYDMKLPPYLKGEPGVGDITKQLFYNQVLEPKAKSKGYKRIINCLVFPSNDEEFIRVSGTVNIDGVSGGPLLVIYMDLFKAFERYLTSNSLTHIEQINLLRECQDVHSA